MKIFNGCHWDSNVRSAVCRICREKRPAIGRNICHGMGSCGGRPFPGKTGVCKTGGGLGCKTNGINWRNWVVEMFINVYQCLSIFIIVVEMLFINVYPLVNRQKTIERSTIFNGKIHYFYGHFQ